jgi:hypothetical protein
VTFKDLQEAFQSNGQINIESKIVQLQDKPFWIFDKGEHKQEYIRTGGLCCLWHGIGCPQKDGRDMPVLPYQKILYDALQNHKHIWILKSRGIGCSEFLLRYIAWYCITRFSRKMSRVCFIVGPRIDLAEDLIARFKGLFSQQLTNDRESSTVTFLNGVRVEAFPSHHVDTMRGLTDVKFILSDESDMYPTFQQREVHIPSIQKNRYEWLDYHLSLEGSSTFNTWGLWATASLPHLSRTVKRLEYNPQNIHQNVKKSIGIDPSYGSSNFAICATQLVDGKIQVIEASEYQRPNFTDMIEKVWQLKQRYGYVSNIYVDAANPEIWQALKREFGENYNDQWVRDQIAECRKYNLHVEDRMFVVPVPFSVEGAKMLQHTKWLLDERDEDGSSLIAIHPSFDKLLTSLRTAVANEYRLDKTETSYDDILDAFRLALTFYKRAKE